MLLHELVQTGAMRVELWRARRELRQLQSEFPPRRGASPFWPAPLLVAAGAGIFLLAHRPHLAHTPAFTTLEARRQVDFVEAWPVFLSVVSEPLGAQVEATWSGGSKSGRTPLSLEVPKNSEVRFVFSKDGAIATTKIIADQPQVVRGLFPRRAQALPIGDFRDERGH